MGGVICTFVVQKMTLNILFLLHLEEEKGLKTKKKMIFTVFIFFILKKKSITHTLESNFFFLKF